ncbi:MAG: GNAT family N-acetyltransferase [Micavibrio aeruginosavorus]|uniref:GNAT family N-acetyltransferase n=1 Tax=Micavibrio aeruginosavorus TaxID=349221 RepID=A0A7T5UGW5_9BACT|nr:MAG: GNAT family N-acetyltransferase [Micavibrio aeruginosavorus]
MTIEPFSEDFLSEVYIGWLNDPVITRYSQQRHRRHDRESCRTFMNSFDRNEGHFSALTLTQDNRRHIGNISTTVDPYNQVADIAILIGDQNLWGKGYGLEAWKAVQDHLLQSGMRLVTGGCMATNKGMKTVMEKAGMRLYYIRRNYFLCEGQSVDSIHYVIGEPV